MKPDLLITVLSLVLSALLAPTVVAQEVLPFPPAPSGSTAGLTMQDSIYKKRFEPKRLADGAPNILIILIDDVGPATPSTYGGEIHTPTLRFMFRGSTNGGRTRKVASSRDCSQTARQRQTRRRMVVVHDSWRVGFGLGSRRFVLASKDNRCFG